MEKRNTKNPVIRVPEWMKPEYNGTPAENLAVFKHVSRFREWFKTPAKYYVTARGTIFGKRARWNFRNVVLRALYRLWFEHGVEVAFKIMLKMMSEKERIDMQNCMIASSYRSKYIFHPVVGYVGFPLSWRKKPYETQSESPE